MAQPAAEEAQSRPVAQTVVNDQSALARLRGNSGITLQWINFTYSDGSAGARRGHVSVADRGNTVHISGVQFTADGEGYVSVTGDIAEIGSDYFILDGRIVISGAPDADRQCIKTGRSRFAITQNRRYWRMREFEWCDSLTDYIDIYF
ncbi:hypothetical protein [Parasphingopyxis sp.]|uniref:hypothetical protein n=1 Tax=Parasphingopyxis sp. TaxID=1920299 RepID=UPI00261213C7|nr:hypothetical protein [Parasphingopyxis sp.]